MTTNSVHLPTLLTQEFKNHHMILQCDRSDLTNEECQKSWGPNTEEYFGTVANMKAGYRLWFITQRDGFGDPENFWCMTLVDGNDYRACHSILEIIGAYEDYRATL